MYTSAIQGIIPSLLERNLFRLVVVATVFVAVRAIIAAVGGGEISQPGNIQSSGSLVAIFVGAAALYAEPVSKSVHSHRRRFDCESHAGSN